MADRFKLVYTVPASHLAVTKDAVFKTGAGVYDEGKYVQVAFELIGSGQFMPVAAAGADPHTGAVDNLEKVLEYRVEVLCVGRDVTKATVDALKSAHPYEVPAYEVYKLEDFKLRRNCAGLHTKDGSNLQATEPREFVNLCVSTFRHASRPNQFL